MDSTRPLNGASAGDELLKRILASQKTIIEQNVKILERQEKQQLKITKKTTPARHKCPWQLRLVLKILFVEQ